MSDFPIRDVTGYQTSKDYDLLWRAAHESSVVCLVDYGSGRRDVAHTLAQPCEVSVSARGVCYLAGDTMEAFAEACRESNLEWIVKDNGQAGIWRTA